MGLCVGAVCVLYEYSTSTILLGSGIFYDTLPLVCYRYGVILPVIRMLGFGGILMM
ncbi:hypothetical protein HOY80DRAFT_952487, partial [Tuber brumale]